MKKFLLLTVALIFLKVSLSPIKDQETANKLASETTKEGCEKIANLAIQKRNNAQNDLS